MRKSIVNVSKDNSVRAMVSVSARLQSTFQTQLLACGRKTERWHANVRRHANTRRDAALFPPPGHYHQHLMSAAA